MDIDTHTKHRCTRRKYKCLHCEEFGEYQERKTTHLSECPKVMVDCPNTGCVYRTVRCKMKEHREQSCQYEEQKCKYANIGCTVTVLRRDLAAHQNNSDLHLKLAIDKVSDMQAILDRQEKRITTIESAQSFGSVIFQVKHVAIQMRNRSTVLSPPFCSSPHGYKFCMGVTTCGIDGLGTHISVYVYPMKGENDDNLRWPFMGTVLIELLNQLEDKDHFEGEVVFPGQRVVDSEYGWGMGYSQFISHSELSLNRSKRTQFLLDDCLYFRTSVTLPTTNKSWLTNPQVMT